MSKKKVRVVKDKNKTIIAAKVSRDKLQDSFDEYYDNLLKLLKADELKIEHYDEDLVIVYDRNKNYNIQSNVSR